MNTTKQTELTAFRVMQPGARSTGDHSPLPWKYQVHTGRHPGYSDWNDCTIRNEKTNVCIAVVGSVDRYYEKDSEANAAFIVRACNNAQRLADALAEVIDEIKSRFDYETATPEEETAFCKAESALAQWEGDKQ